MFRIKLKELREEKNLSQYEFAKVFGVAQSTVGGWESGARIPRLPMIEKIAAFFNVSTDYLLGKEDDAEPSVDQQLSEEEFALFGEVRNLTPEEKKRVLDFIRFTKSQRGE